MINQVYETYEDGIYSLRVLIMNTNDGILLYVEGGEKPHLGTVVISQPRPSLKGDNNMSCTTSILNRLSHKDDLIIVPLAEAVCLKMNSFVVASGGVHISNAKEFQIKRLIKNMKALTETILLKL